MAEVVRGALARIATSDLAVMMSHARVLIMAAGLGVALFGCAEREIPYAPGSVLPPETARFSSVSPGWGFTCGIQVDSTAVCWGANHYGQLGSSNNEAVCPIDWGVAHGPCSVWPARVNGDLKFVALDAGDDHVCALTTDGAAYCWGSNNAGQLGTFESPERCSADEYAKEEHGQTLCARSPRAVATLLRFTTVAAGRQFTCGLTAAGIGHCWGAWSRGKLGGVNGDIPHASIVAFSAPEPFVSISANDKVCGLSMRGLVYCWGGHGPAVPTLVQSDLAFASISVGLGYMCGVARDGTAHCRGENDSGQLGDGEVVRRFQADSTWHAVVGDLQFHSISAGFATTCGITVDDALYCWGNGSQPGENRPDKCFHVDEFNPCALRPVRIPLDSVAATGAAVAHNCAVVARGAAYCWGTNVSHESSASRNKRLNAPSLIVRH